MTNLRSPDIIAIEEMQDNSGPANDGVTASDLSWQRLIDAIVAAGGPAYDYRQIDPENNADGGAPGGNIRVGFLFRPSDDLRFVDRPGGDATTDTDVVKHRGDPQLTISPGRVLDAAIGGEAAFELTPASRSSVSSSTAANRCSSWPTTSARRATTGRCSATSSLRSG